MNLPPPDTKVLAFQKNSNGNIIPVIAVYLPKFFKEDVNPDETTGFDLICDYDEENDKYYWESGWYECVQNWGDFSYLKVVPQSNVISWQPINYPEAK